MNCLRLRFWHLALAAILFAFCIVSCSGQTSAPRIVAALQLNLSETGTYIVDVRINGLTRHMILDTGSSVTLLKPAVDLQESSLVVHGKAASGNVTAHVTSVTLQLGDYMLTGFRAYVTPLNFPPSIDGILGLDVLNRFKLMLDPKAHTVTLVQ